MKPTSKLRFIDRVIPAPEFGERTCKKVRVLQQWWESNTVGTLNFNFGGEIPLGEVIGEWRDVPLEVE